MRSSPLSEPHLSHNVQTHMLQLSRCDPMPEECNSSSFSPSASVVPSGSIDTVPSPLPKLRKISSFPPLQSLPFVALFFLYFLTSRLPHTDTGVKLTGQNTSQPWLSDSIATEVKRNTGQTQTHSQSARLRNSSISNRGQLDVEQLFPRAVNQLFGQESGGAEAA